MSNQFDPTYAIPDDDGADCQMPTRDELFAAWIHGTLTLDQWSDAMNCLYPLTDAELAAQREKLAVLA